MDGGRRRSVKAGRILGPWDWCRRTICSAADLDVFFWLSERLVPKKKMHFPGYMSDL